LEIFNEQGGEQAAAPRAEKHSAKGIVDHCVRDDRNMPDWRLYVEHPVSGLCNARK